MQFNLLNMNSYFNVKIALIKIFSKESPLMKYKLKYSLNWIVFYEIVKIYIKILNI